MKEGRNYLEKFKGKLFLIKISGELVNDQSLEHISKDISILSQNDIKIIVVHGGGYQADELSKKLRTKIKKVNGRRITDPDSLEIVKMVFGKLNIEIVASLKKFDVKPIGLSGIEGGIKAKKREIKTIDYGFVGDILDIDTSLVNILLQSGFIPVISPLASNENGTILNINADTIAVEFAKKLCIDKLVLLSNVSGVFEKLGDNSSLISYLSVSKIEDLIQKGSVDGGMIPKLESCISAINHGVQRIHLINGKVENALLKEVLTKKGVGTMIISDEEVEVYRNELK